MSICVCACVCTIIVCVCVSNHMCFIGQGATKVLECLIVTQKLTKRQRDIDRLCVCVCVIHILMVLIHTAAVSIYCSLQVTAMKQKKARVNSFSFRVIHLYAMVSWNVFMNLFFYLQVHILHTVVKLKRLVLTFHSSFLQQLFSHYCSFSTLSPHDWSYSRREFQSADESHLLICPLLSCVHCSTGAEWARFEHLNALLMIERLSFSMNHFPRLLSKVSHGLSHPFLTIISKAETAVSHRNLKKRKKKALTAVKGQEDCYGIPDALWKITRLQQNEAWMYLIRFLIRQVCESLPLCFIFTISPSVLSFPPQAPCRKLLNAVLRGLELTVFPSDRDIYIPNCDTRGYYRKKQVQTIRLKPHLSLPYTSSHQQWS